MNVIMGILWIIIMYCMVLLGLMGIMTLIIILHLITNVEVFHTVGLKLFRIIDLLMFKKL